MGMLAPGRGAQIIQTGERIYVVIWPETSDLLDVVISIATIIYFLLYEVVIKNILFI
jgi:hypothetical protein